MKVIRKVDKTYIDAFDMKVGQLGIIIKKTTSVGQLVLRVFEGLVSLSDPHLVWDVLKKPTSIAVELLSVGEKVILEQE